MSNLKDMKVHCPYDELVAIENLKPHPKNLNRHPKDQIERLAKILKYQGVRYPAKVSNQSGFLTAGHGRVEAAKLIGWTHFPVSFQDYESQDQEIADLHADNQIASWAEFDFSGLNMQVPEFGPDFDVDMFGVKNFEIDVADKEGLCDEDEVPEHVEPKTRLGDIYQLGQHRLMCGDSTSIDAVENLMNGEKADMVFTDPPYGIGYRGHYSTDGGSRVQRHGLNVNSFDAIQGDFDALNMSEVLAPFDYVKEIFVWGAQNFAKHLPYSTWLCWDRKLTESADKSLSGDFDLCWSKQKHKMKMYRFTWHGVFGHSRIDDGEKKVHPTMKPVALIEAVFNDYADKNSLIVDLFGGSGSTLIACEKTNRKCFMMEIDPHYTSIIIERWCKYTGEEAYLLNEDGTKTSWTEVRAMER